MTEFPVPAPAGKSRRRRFAPLAVVAGVGATAALALSMTGTLSAFTAQITNSTNTVGTGTLIMSETGNNSLGAPVTCTSVDGTGNNITTNAATCGTISKYGYGTNLVPGSTTTTTVSFKNTGTAAAATFTLAAGTCGPPAGFTPVTGAATDLCSQIGIVITHTVNNGAPTTITPANSTLASINAATPAAFGTLGPVAAGSAQTDSFTFTITVKAGLNNTYQGLQVNQPLVWQYNAGS